ncbi:MAG TPA: FecR domain-containing protein, partial [Candidatus Sulfotelmatobacter sp.]|nr:FecR domain-containing protein [Candidatus Sulfotelmatobacter sp.]
MPRDLTEQSAYQEHPARAHQIAQAAGAGAAQPIGRVDTVTGGVTAQHVDGSVATLAQGDPVYQKDLISTQAGAKVALVFADKTTFALGESGQLRLDELVYNPAGHSGTMAVSMLKGAFAFVSGDIAGTQADAMTVRTPVGTIGIRGTAVAGTIDPNGHGSRIAAVRDPSGAPSTIVFTNAGGTQVITENNMLVVLTFFTAPGVPTPITPGALGEAGDLSFTVSTIASTVNPGGSESGGPAGGAGAPPQGPGTPGGTTETTIHVTLAEQPVGTGGGGAGGLFSFNFDVTITAVDTTLPLPPPPPPHPPPSDETPTSTGGFVGTLGVDNFIGHPAPVVNFFDFTHVPNSLQSGDHVVGGGGADTLSAEFNAPFTINSSLVVTDVPNIDLKLDNAPGNIDALGITSGAAGTTTITASGSGALTITDLRVDFDGHAMASPMSISAAPQSEGAGITIEPGQGSNTLTGAGFNYGDVLSYAHAAGPLVLDYAAGTAVHGGVTDTIAGFDGFIGTPFNDNIDVSSIGGGSLISITVEGGAGNNTMTGSFSNTDFVSYAHSPSGVTVDFSVGVTSDNGYGGTDVFSGFVGAIGSAHDDLFITTDSTVSIIGGGGQDTVEFNGTASNDITLNGIDQVSFVNPNATTTDVVMIAAPNGFVVNLGNGDDSINVTIDDALSGPGISGAVAVGTGDDTVSLIGSSDVLTAVVNGQFGADSLAIGGSSDVMVVAAVDDLIHLSASGSGDTFQFVGGDDGFVVPGSSESFTIGLSTGNPYDDYFTVSGGNDTIALNATDDFFELEATGAGDTYNLTGTGNTAFVFNNFETFTIGASPGSSDTIYLYGGDDTIALAGTDDSFTIAQTGDDDMVNIVGSHQTVTINGADDVTVLLSGSADVITLNGADTVSVGGNGDAITFGGGIDSGDVTMTGSGSTLSVTVENTITHFSFSVAGGSDVLTINDNGSNSDDTITLSGGGDVLTINDDAGFSDDTITATGSADTISVATGDDDIIVVNATGSADSIAVTGYDDTISVTGSGDSFNFNLTGIYDFVTVTGGGNAIALTGSDDTLGLTVAGGSGDAVTVLGNDDELSITVDDTLTALNFGSATDTVDGSFNCATVDDNVALNLAVYGHDDSISLTSATADDTIAVSGSHDTINGGGGDDSVAVSGAHDFVSLSGAGQEQISVSGNFDTVDFGTGGSSVTVTGSHDYINDAMALPGDDTVTVSIGGFDTVMLGNGDDTVTLNSGHDNVSLGFGCDAVNVSGGAES